MPQEPHPASPQPAPEARGFDRRSLLRSTAAGGLALFGGVGHAGQARAAAPATTPAHGPTAAAPATRAAASTPGELFAAWQANPGDHPQIPDVSHAGYRGGAPIPDVPTVVRAADHGAVPDGTTDNTDAIQRAIIAAADAGGGAVALAAGDYRCDGFLRLNRSGVVLRGEGQDRTRIVFTRSLEEILGPNLEDGKSQWCWSGGLIWIGPTDTFDSRLQLLDWAGQPVDMAQNQTNSWEQWRGGGDGEGSRLARVVGDPPRGTATVKVDTTAQLIAGRHALMTWRSRGAEGDFGLLKRLGAHPLMRDGYDWPTADRMYAPATPRFRWPVRIASLTAEHVALAQPLRIGVTAAELDTDFQTMGQVITESGVEHLTIVTAGAHDPAEGHLTDRGANGIFFNRVIDCWARDIAIEQAENGVLFSCAKSVTVERFAVRSELKVHHFTAVRSFSADILQQDFTLDAPRVWHGINHEWLASGCVWSRGHLAHGTFDSHRGLPFDNVRTEITLERNDGQVGGAPYAGPRNGRRIAHWNVENRGTSGTAVFQPDMLTHGALVGMRGPRDDRCADAMVCGDKNVVEVGTGAVPEPANLHAAQRALRLDVPPLERAAVVEALRRVADHWIATHPEPGSNEWHNATYHSGNVALFRLTEDARYLDHSLRWAEHHGWGLNGGVETRFADNHAAGDVYLDLHEIDPAPNRLAAIEASLHRMTYTDRPEKNDDWWWTDALHMAMPPLARLGALRDDPAYWAKMYALYDHTKRRERGPGLYSYRHELWFRDGNYLPGGIASPGGRDVLWSRGNGWAMMAHAKVLRALPADEEHVVEYGWNLEGVSRALRDVQRADGFWNVSLRDPDHFGGRETSGTAMHLYGLAYGVRTGRLDRDTYLPVVTRAWNALVRDAIREDGLLGWVQGVGYEPESSQPVTATTTSDFAVGAVLLAGTEVAALAS
ncbi:hypothetical protein FH609_025455 [Streptomyces sp. 3MP-14]|uniref:Rhamnogalacturonase A/B/Epimerase-like pectate lyase domain-containing protein n=1 Tax=Streptomyces mimosae TaxID=2586635 RepID=A0A5N6A2P9_9ACTN|nr:MULTISPECIES: glycoside hydrolase family 88 protein [Streptomyces]KAB8161960.1 hypothetical protein FH607_023105 [Streptomyces mimosae]KAB8173658.1 hypothetical protein FH609_025455 [Streptomyces sp. 3MP-14]